MVFYIYDSVILLCLFAGLMFMMLDSRGPILIGVVDTVSYESSVKANLMSVYFYVHVCLSDHIAL